MLETALTNGKSESPLDFEEYNKCPQDWVSPLRETHVGAACKKGVIVGLPGPDGRDRSYKLSSPNHKDNPEYYIKTKKMLIQQLRLLTENDEVTTH